MMLQVELRRVAASLVVVIRELDPSQVKYAARVLLVVMSRGSYFDLIISSFSCRYSCAVPPRRVYLVAWSHLP